MEYIATAHGHDAHSLPARSNVPSSRVYAGLYFPGRHIAFEGSDSGSFMLSTVGSSDRSAKAGLGTVLIVEPMDV